MVTTTRNLRRYDHRLRELVRSTGDIQHAIHRGVPRSTAHGWLKSPRTEIITVDPTDMDVLRLQQELLTLRRRVARLIALLRLLVVLLRLSGFSLASSRIPHGAGKYTLMRAIERSTAILPLHVVLRVLRLSRSRYHSWKREKECGLDDITSCLVFRIRHFVARRRMRCTSRPETRFPVGLRSRGKQHVRREWRSIETTRARHASR